MAPRSAWKGPYVDNALRNLTDGAKIYSRASTILSDFIGLLVHIHNGKHFIPVKITDEMVGHKFGEFACTRKLKNMRKAAGVPTSKGAKPGTKKK